MVVSPADRADNADGVSLRLHVVAYEVPECEFLSGGLYGHPAPKRAAEPSNRTGVSAGGPAYGHSKLHGGPAVFQLNSLWLDRTCNPRTSDQAELISLESYVRPIVSLHSSLQELVA